VLKGFDSGVVQRSFTIVYFQFRMTIQSLSIPRSCWYKTVSCRLPQVHRKERGQGPAGHTSPQRYST